VGSDARRIAAEQTHPLRHAVLRPTQPVEAVRWDGDDAPDTAHFGAFEGDRLVAVGTVLRDAPKGSPDARAWRLRGMATAPEARGRGHGAAIVRAALAHVRAQGGTLLWFNARTGAVGFYEKLGFVKSGAEFDVPHAGPHFYMEMRLG
jgi:GNAT superfamily N-acetyltransferase